MIYILFSENYLKITILSFYKLTNNTKTIHVNKELWLRLNRLKLDNCFSTIGDVVESVILKQEYKDCFEDTSVKVDNISKPGYIDKEVFITQLFALIDDMSHIERFNGKNWYKLEPELLKKLIKERLM